MRNREQVRETNPQPMTARKGLRRSTKHSDRQRRRNRVMASSAVHNRDEKTPQDSNTNCRYNFHVWLHSTTDHNSAPVVEERVPYVANCITEWVCDDTGELEKVSQNNLKIYFDA